MKFLIPNLFLTLFLILISTTQSAASVISYRSTHPVSWMHGLPNGESPGWSSKKWLIAEVQHANFWNVDMDIRDKRSGDIYSFGADFEQLMIQLESGFQISKKLSFSFSLPVVSRFGGFLDQPLDDWHKFVGADRFRRNQFKRGGNNFSIRKNGEELLGTSQASGLNALNLKLKWWLYQKSDVPRPEMQGLALSFQSRLPLRGPQSTLTTGQFESSALLHAGTQLRSWGYVWVTAGMTKLSANPILQGWPTRQWSQLYEGWLEIPLGQKWNLIVQARYQSPLLDKQHLEFQYLTTSEKNQSAERAASGWSGLTAWRGSESLGVRYKIKKSETLTFLFQEDWAFGDNDGRKNFLYVHGAPDVALVAQYQIGF
jgi:hypothetical protein